MQQYTTKRVLGGVLGMSVSIVAGCGASGSLVVLDPPASTSVLGEATVGADVPLPPGVQPLLLAPRPEDSSPARRSLEQAIEMASRAIPVSTPPASEPLAAETRDRALRHYVRGRDAALARKMYVAITELEKALALDPTSPKILRELARSYLSMKNIIKAAKLFERLLVHDPYDSETLYTLGMAAVSRRDFENAAAYLSRPFQHGEGYDHDAAAGLLAMYRLAESMMHLGYDEAVIDLTTALLEALDRGLAAPTGYAQSLEAVYVRRGELWQWIGDARCRLGRYDGALAAYQHAKPLIVDEDALLMRTVYAHLSLGRAGSAQALALDAIGTGERPVTDRDIRLCAYLASALDDPSRLATAMIERSRLHPDDPALARAAATLLNRRDAVRLLQRFLDRRPDDMEIYGQLVGWLVVQDPAATAELALSLAEAHPELAPDYADRLTIAAPSRAAMVEAISAQTPSVARGVVRTRLLASQGALGAAWSSLAVDRKRWRDSQSLLREQIVLTGRLQDAALLDEIVIAADPADPETWRARSRARRQLGQGSQALVAASQALALAPRDAAVKLEVAEVRILLAAVGDDLQEQQTNFGLAVAMIEEVLAVRPDDEVAFDLLLQLYGPGGMHAQISRDGQPRSLQQEMERAEGIRDRLGRIHPDSRLGRRFDARRDILQHRTEAALGKLLSLYESDPTDTESLMLAMAVWEQIGDVESADQWLTRQLDERPSDPSLLSEWVEVQLRRNRFNQTVGRLESIIDVEPFHDVARVHLELLYRRLGHLEQAVLVAEKRLLSQPRGVRRELELAAMYAASEKSEAATDRLRWILEDGRAASYEQLASAMRLTSRLSETGAADDALALAFVERVIDRFPESPLQVYGNGLRALARMQQIDERFEELVTRAIFNSAGATGSSLRAADTWRQLAQALIDAGHPAAAAEALRVRLLSESPLDPSAATLIASGMIISGVAADEPRKTIEVLTSLEKRDRLPGGLGLEPDDDMSEILYNLSGLYMLLGKHDGSLVLLRRVLELDESHVMSANNLAYTLIERGVHDTTTVELIEQAYANRPDDTNILDTVGWLHYKSGRFEGTDERPAARRHIEAAIKGSEDPGAEVLGHLGDVLWRSGDLAGARDAWIRAVGVLEDPLLREQILRVYGLIQVRRWGLLVADPNELYEANEGAQLERLRGKLRNAEEGIEPAVAPTFSEQASQERP